MFQIIYICFLIIFGFNLCHCFEEAWNSHNVGLGNNFVEELVVTKVEVVENLQIKSNVTKWKSLTIGSTCYSVGWVNNYITIIFTTMHVSGSKFDVENIIEDVERSPTDVMFLQSRSDGLTEIFLVASFSETPEIEWYRVRSHRLEKYWSLNLNKPVKYMNSFVLDRRLILILICDNFVRSFHLDLFEVDIKSKMPQYWHLQSFELISQPNSTAVNQINDNYFLSVPQSELDYVIVFKYQDKHFKKFKYINSPKVTSVVSFDIMSKTFLAIDGYNAGVFEFCNNGEIKKNRIVNSNLDGINYWLPIPVVTLRDEVILLAQRYLDHGSHKTFVVEIIVYNGGEFEEHEDIPCLHFGEKVEWLTCLTDDNGLIGSSFVFVSEKVGLIVPRISNGSSFLFTMDISVRQMDNPRKKDLGTLADLKQRLQKHIASIEEDIQLRVNIASDIDTDLSPFVLALNTDNITVYQDAIRELEENIRTLEERLENITVFESRDKFNTLIIKGAFTMEMSDFRELNVETINDTPTTALLEDIVNKNTINGTLSNKTFTDLHVENMEFDKLNGISSEDILYKINGSISINGDVIFKNVVTLGNANVLLNKLGDIDIADDLVYVGREFDGNLTFENIIINNNLKTGILNDIDLTSHNYMEESHNIPGNLTVTYINGINFTEFVYNICLVNVECVVPGTFRVDGNITVEDGNAEYLNQLNFPEEFIFMDDIPHANITGIKNFNNLTAKEVRMSGRINNLVTSQLVTLSTHQDMIQGNFTFNDLELTKELNVTGRISGQHINKFLPNPTLNETNHIKSNTDFETIEIEGKVIVRESLNGKPFSDLVSGILYDDEDESMITSIKDFQEQLTLAGNLDISSVSINNVHLDSIITKNTEQVLNIDAIQGNVKIGKLNVIGFYDEINVNQLDENLVKLTGEQFISSTLIFSDDIDVKNLELSKLNDLLPQEYVYTSGEARITGNVTFGNLTVEKLDLLGNLSTNESNFDLQSLRDRYLSLNKDQAISTEWIMRLSKIDSLKSGIVNQMADIGVLDFGEYRKQLRNRLQNEPFPILNLRINGSIHINKLNDEDIHYYLPRDFLGSEIVNKTDLIIMQNAFLDEIEISLLSNVSWDRLIDLLIFKNESNISLRDNKRFKNGLHIEKLLQTKSINNVSIENIFNLEGAQTISGPVILHGKIEIEDAHIFHNINKVNVTNVLYNFRHENGSYILRGDKLLERLVHIYDLNIEGLVNKRHFQNILSEAIFTSSDSEIEGDIIFENKVHINGNIAVNGLMNGVNIAEIVPKVVLSTQDTEIEGPISFLETVLITRNIEVDQSLRTQLLFGINTDKWVENAIYMDKGFLNGSYTFEKVTIHDELQTLFINDTDSHRLIPLRSSQIIDQLKFGRVISVSNITVGNRVNGHIMTKDFENTVMRDREQHINSEITFQNNILVRDTLTTAAINDFNASDIVTTQTNQRLTGSYKFLSRFNAEGNIVVDGLVNGINLTKWKADSVAIFSPKPQRITNRWEVNDNINFEDEVSGAGCIENINLTSLSKEVESRILEKLKLEDDILRDYKSVCTHLKTIHNIARKQIYKFKYFEDFQWISYPNNIQYTFHFEHYNKHYLLVNDEDCLSHLLYFDGESFYPLTEKIVMGNIQQIIKVTVGNQLFLVARHDNKDKRCSIEGTYIWELSDDTVKLKHAMEDQRLLQSSHIPSTFYGLSQKGVVEYKMSLKDGYHEFRRWNYNESGALFVPRGLRNTGLALRTGKKLIMLERSSKFEIIPDIDANSNVVLKGNYREFPNHFLPGENEGDVTVVTVGIEGHKRNLLVVVENSNKGADWIKVIKYQFPPPQGKKLELFFGIYTDPLIGELMQQIPARKPTSLISFELGNAESLLAFIENGRHLQIYEYKGILGFKQRSSVRISGSKLLTMTLPTGKSPNQIKCLGIIDANEIRITSAIMEGNQIKNEFTCNL